MKELDPFKYTGPLDPEQDKMVTIRRDEELKDVCNGLRHNTYYAIVAPRQTGKTTFLFQLTNEINRTLPGYQSIYVTLEDLVHVQRAEFYEHFARKMITSLASNYQFQSSSVKQSYKNVSTNLDLKDFFLELAEAKFCRHHHSSNDCIDFGSRDEYTNLKFVLLVDEIDGIPNDILIEFVKTIRSIFIERLSIHGFKAYTIVLCGSADLASLTYGKTSPFNISKVIYLRDFHADEVSRWLSQVLQYLEIQSNGSFSQQLFGQTQGHPYLGQRLCSRILRRLSLDGRSQVNEEDLEEVNHIITSGDINLMTTFQKVKSDELLQEMLMLILQGKPIRYSRTHSIIYNLELAGAIRGKDEFCQIRNPIYEKFFRQQLLP